MYATIRAGSLALMVFALLALAGPTGAAIRPDDRAGVRGLARPVPTTQMRPDDRPGFRGIAPDSSTELANGHALRGTASGFDWTSAGAGAGAATAVVLVLAGALTVRRGHRRVEASA
jgi:hypothetical protein